MKDRDQKYYICKSGEVKKRAEEYRKTFLRLKAELWRVVETFGADSASIDDEMMLIRGIAFKGATPQGWTKPKHGISYPKRGTLGFDARKHFTPSGSYSVEMHKELRPFREWLKCPFGYHYTIKAGQGFTHIGRLFNRSFVYWYDSSGPIMLELPDVAGAKARALESGETVVDGVLDWVPPKGLKEILPEEWALMAARHKQATGK